MSDNTIRQVQRQLSRFDVCDIRAIFKPMMKHFDVDYVTFSRGYADGSDINLSTDPDWMDYYYRHQLYCNNPLEKEIQQYSSGYSLWSEVMGDTDLIQMYRQRLKVMYAFILIKPHHSGDYCDFFIFGSHSSNSCFEQKFVRNISLVNQFIDHFNYHAADMISALARQRIYIPRKHSLIVAEPDSLRLYRNHVDRELFISELTKHGSIVRSGDQLIRLTKREASLVPFIISGLSMREIADQCSISPRTVETHLVRIKQKLFATSKPDLIKKLRATHPLME
ncbi:MAG: LuxR C-terminal-related transcriptional regulator [Coxiellaceae bacterium]|nr:LuxR C-terminal-related transcriptional regulator [Coxiellaceae bacterium]